MGSSHGFGSTPRDDIALLRLAFAMAPAGPALTRPRRVTRRVILQKARRHTTEVMLRLHGSIRFQGLFHSPRRGTFHRSLTVLCAIGQWGYVALEGGPPRFPPGTSCLAVLRNGATAEEGWPNPAITVYGGVFQTPEGPTHIQAVPAGRLTLSALQPHIRKSCHLGTDVV